MGYIAPIPHHQYKQYQEREIKVDKHPFQFIPVQPIKALKNKSKQTDHEEMSSYPLYEQDKSMIIHTRKSHKSPIPPELLARVTGKGTHFNEYV
ncbi:hypothetical protein [Bacillus sp. Marseille-Q1617]|uniref:hypothetical protein n=1 Tax=Bacillus sp. Marseille-Q1617 TaxID=2736887 RepID=UPI001589EED0|nr:hypothetical protein [Bacillus sp. Marseille-Q1617]